MLGYDCARNESNIEASLWQTKRECRHVIPQSLSEEAKSGSVSACEELKYSSDNICSVGVARSVAHSIKPANPANDCGNHDNKLGDCANGLSGSSVVDSDDNCPRKDA